MAFEPLTKDAVTALQNALEQAAKGWYNYKHEEAIGGKGDKENTLIALMDSIVESVFSDAAALLQERLDGDLISADVTDISLDEELHRLSDALNALSAPSPGLYDFAEKANASTQIAQTLARSEVLMSFEQAEHFTTQALGEEPTAGEAKNIPRNGVGLSRPVDAWIFNAVDSLEKKVKANIAIGYERIKDVAHEDRRDSTPDELASMVILDEAEVLLEGLFEKLDNLRESRLNKGAERQATKGTIHSGIMGDVAELRRLRQSDENPIVKDALMDCELCAEVAEKIIRETTARTLSNAQSNHVEQRKEMDQIDPEALLEQYGYQGHSRS
jgi:hypothetical protein